MFRQSSILSLYLFFFSFFSVSAQEIKPNAYFLKDSIKIGESIPYSISIKYPRKMQVVFPDSSYIFMPFEFDKKIFFNTRSDSIFSFDSVVYYLNTFEIEKVQKLALPIYVISNGDSTPVFAQSDSVFLIEKVNEIEDPADLKETIELREVKRQFNYPYFILGSISLILIFVLLFSLLGKPVRQRLRIYRLEKTHKKFEKRYLMIVKEIQHNESQEKSELLLFFWKDYMERLEGIPYKKLTTREILEYEKNAVINNELRSIDRNIYGNKADNHLFESFTKLLEVTRERFENKKEEVLNG